MPAQAATLAGHLFVCGPTTPIGMDKDAATPLPAQTLVKIAIRVSNPYPSVVKTFSSEIVFYGFLLEF